QLWMESMPKSEEHSMWKIMVGDVAKSCTEMQSGIERQALSSEGQEELNWRVKADEASNEVSIFTAKMVGKDNEIDKRKEDIHKAQIKLEAAEEKAKDLSNDLRAAQDRVVSLSNIEALLAKANKTIQQLKSMQKDKEPGESDDLDEDVAEAADDGAAGAEAMRAADELMNEAIRLGAQDGEEIKALRTSLHGFQSQVRRLEKEKEDLKTKVSRAHQELAKEEFQRMSAEQEVESLKAQIESAAQHSAEKIARIEADVKVTLHKAKTKQLGSFGASATPKAGQTSDLSMQTDGSPYAVPNLRETAVQAAGLHDRKIKGPHDTARAVGDLVDPSKVSVQEALGKDEGPDHSQSMYEYVEGEAADGLRKAKKTGFNMQGLEEDDETEGPEGLVETKMPINPVDEKVRPPVDSPECEENTKSLAADDHGGEEHEEGHAALVLSEAWVPVPQEPAVLSIVKKAETFEGQTRRRRRPATGKATASSTKTQPPEQIEADLAEAYECAGGDDDSWKRDMGDAATDYSVASYDSTKFRSSQVFADKFKEQFDSMVLKAECFIYEAMGDDKKPQGQALAKLALMADDFTARGGAWLRCAQFAASDSYYGVLKLKRGPVPACSRTFDGEIFVGSDPRAFRRAASAAFPAAAWSFWREEPARDKADKREDSAEVLGDGRKRNKRGKMSEDLAAQVLIFNKQGAREKGGSKTSVRVKAEDSDQDNEDGAAAVGAAVAAEDTVGGDVGSSFGRAPRRIVSLPDTGSLAADAEACRHGGCRGEGRPGQAVRLEERRAHDKTKRWSAATAEASDKGGEDGLSSEAEEDEEREPRFARSAEAEVLNHMLACEAGVNVRRCITREPGKLGKLARSRFRRGDKTVPMEQRSGTKSATGQRDLAPLPIPRWVHDRLERELDDECRPLAKRSKRSLGSLLGRVFVEVTRPCQWNRVVEESRRQANVTEECEERRGQQGCREYALEAWAYCVDVSHGGCFGLFVGQRRIARHGKRSGWPVPGPESPGGSKRSVGKEKALGVAALGVAALGVAALGVAALGVAALGVAALGVAAHGVAALGVAALGVAALGVAAPGVAALGVAALGVAALGVAARSLQRKWARAGSGNEVTPSDRWRFEPKRSSSSRPGLSTWAGGVHRSAEVASEKVGSSLQRKWASTGSGNEVMPSDRWRLISVEDPAAVACLRWLCEGKAEGVLSQFQRKRARARSGNEAMPSGRRQVLAVWNKDQRARQRRELESLGSNVIGKGTLTRYRNSVDVFVKFADEERRPLSSCDKVDKAACSFVEQLWENGDGEAAASYTLAGLQLLQPKLKKHLPITMGLLIVLAFVIFLRTGEIFQLQRSDITFSKDGLVAVVSLRDTKGSKRSKVQQTERITVKDPAAAACLHWLCHGKAEGERLSSLSSNEFRGLWVEAIKALGLEDFPALLLEAGRRYENVSPDGEMAGGGCEEDERELEGRCAALRPVRVCMEGGTGPTVQGVWGPSLFGAEQAH
ncbi:unnamed protein product, partial [Polarella glacialis]